MGRCAPGNAFGMQKPNDRQIAPHRRNAYTTACLTDVDSYYRRWCMTAFSLRHGMDAVRCADKNCTKRHTICTGMHCTDYQGRLVSTARKGGFTPSSTFPPVNSCFYDDTQNKFQTLKNGPQPSAVEKPRQSPGFRGDCLLSQTEFAPKPGNRAPDDGSGRGSSLDRPRCHSHLERWRRHSIGRRCNVGFQHLQLVEWGGHHVERRLRCVVWRWNGQHHLLYR